MTTSAPDNNTPRQPFKSSGLPRLLQLLVNRLSPAHACISFALASTCASLLVIEQLPAAGRLSMHIAPSLQKVAPLHCLYARKKGKGRRVTTVWHAHEESQDEACAVDYSRTILAVAAANGDHRHSHAQKRGASRHSYSIHEIACRLLAACTAPSALFRTPETVHEAHSRGFRVPNKRRRTATLPPPGPLLCCAMHVCRRASSTAHVLGTHLQHGMRAPSREAGAVLSPEEVGW